jgi:arylsulfatase A-like enzyme
MKNKDYNIILINLDGLRRDRVTKLKTFNSLKKESYFFENMDTVAPYTFASLHAIFSGMYPSKNGVNGYYNIFKFKKDKIKTITEYLHQAKFYTSCDVIDDSVIPRQGFDEFNIFDEETVNFSERHSQIIKNLSKKEKFFLFLHYTETHRDLVREVIRKEKQESTNDGYYNSLKENSDRYDSYLPACDEYILSIMRTLEESKIKEKTILIFFSDHGTSIGEKEGEKFYGVFTYDYTLNVFCLINIPGITPKNIKKQCRTIDIFPTIMEITENVEKNLDIQGNSLYELINNKGSDERELFVETGGLYGPWPSPSKPNVFCIKINDKKLIYNDTPQTWEFYDLIKDPCEKNNIYKSDLVDVITLKKRLRYYLTMNDIEINLI